MQNEKSLAKMFLGHPDRDKLIKVLTDALAKNLFDYMDQEGWFKSCLNCGHWNKANTLGPNGSHLPTANDAKSPPETCELYKVRPPAKVIVSGCSSHDEIPF